jgi:hypothetical protein
MIKAGGMKDEQHDWFINACQGLYGTSPEREQAFACKNAGSFAMALMFAAKHLGWILIQWMDLVMTPSARNSGFQRITGSRF